MPTKETVSSSSKDDTKKDVKKDVKAAFSKEQLVNSVKYADKKDILTVVLKDDTLYSFEDVDKEVTNFLERKVI